MKYGTSSIKVEIALTNRRLNASLLDSENCTAFASGYDPITLESGLCTAGSSNGILVTLVDVKDAQPELIIALACSTDCASCGFYGRGKPGDCIALPLQSLFAQVNILSNVASSLTTGVSLLLLLVAAVLL